MDFARQQFHLSETIGDTNITYREHYQVIADKKGEVPEPLDARPPTGFGYLWTWFTELHNARGDGGLPYSEIKAWATLTGRTLSTFEVKTLKRIDMVYLEHRNKQMT